MVDDLITVTDSWRHNPSNQTDAGQAVGADVSAIGVAVGGGAERASRSWRLKLRDLPMRHKAALLVVVSMFVGTMLGDAGGSGWNLWLLMTVLIGGLTSLLIGSYWWVADPLLRLSHRLEMLARAQSTGGIKALPTDREDEVGEVARSARLLCEAAIRDAHEAKRLRRTLDSLVAKETKRATVQLERLAMRDPLTGLGNRRLLEERMGSLMAACRASGEDLVCMLVDVDNFKAVNDELGHAAGDEVLSLIGRMLAGSVRAEDVAVRLGGDEFVLFLPSATAERAGALSEQLRGLLRQQVRRVHPQGPWADLSAGIATLKREGCANGEELLAMADEHLYAAKRAGKGRTYGAGQAGEQGG